MWLGQAIPARAVLKDALFNFLSSSPLGCADTAGIRVVTALICGSRLPGCGYSDLHTALTDTLDRGAGFLSQTQPMCPNPTQL